MDQDEVWAQRRKWLLWTIGIVAAVSLLISIIAICVLLFGWDWTGFRSLHVPPNTQPAKTLWDWLNLLIVPAVLALGGYLFNSSQNRATQAAEERRAQDEALQAYVDKMSDMLIPAIPAPDKPRPSDEAPQGDSLTSVSAARALTHMVLTRLDGDRKRRVVQFLYETGLIMKDRPVIDLEGADLDEANLMGIDMNLNGAALSGVSLRGARLLHTRLNGADLNHASLNNADLGGARLNGAQLSADMAGANLKSAIGESDQTLRNETLAEQVRKGEEWTFAGESIPPNGGEPHRTEPPSFGDHMKGATMPDGKKYEIWIETPEGRAWKEGRHRGEQR